MLFTGCVCVFSQGSQGTAGQDSHLPELDRSGSRTGRQPDREHWGCDWDGGWERKGFTSCLNYSYFLKISHKCLNQIDVPAAWTLSVVMCHQTSQTWHPGWGRWGVNALQFPLSKYLNPSSSSCFLDGDGINTLTQHSLPVFCHTCEVTSCVWPWESWE